MRAEVEVVYFIGCPNAAVVCRALEENGIPFGIVIQDRRPLGDSMRDLSSPSVLVNGTQVIGSKTRNGSAGCTWGGLSADAIVNAVQMSLSDKK